MPTQPSLALFNLNMCSRRCLTFDVTTPQIWAGPEGIIETLKSDDAFKGVKWPTTQSIINHVTHKQSGLLYKYKHLYTPGLEQVSAARRHAACLTKGSLVLFLVVV